MYKNNPLVSESGCIFQTHELASSVMSPPTSKLRFCKLIFKTCPSSLIWKIMWYSFHSGMRLKSSTTVFKNIFFPFTWILSFINEMIWCCFCSAQRTMEFCWFGSLNVTWSARCWSAKCLSITSVGNPNSKNALVYDNPATCQVEIRCPDLTSRGNLICAASARQFKKKCWAKDLGAWLLSKIY